MLSFKNSNFIDDLAPRENGNGVIKNGTLNSKEYSKRFIEKLKSLKNIHLAIDQSASISNKLKIQIERLKVQKQELEKNYSDAVTNLNHILSQTSFSIEVTRHSQQEINKKLLTAPRLNPIMFNVLIVRNKDEENNKKENNGDE